MRNFFLVLCVAAVLTGCAASRTYTATESGRPFPKLTKILLLPPEVRMQEVSAGGIAELVDEWSKKANENLVLALKEQVSEKQMFDIVEMPPLSDAEQEIVEQHTAMYEVVATNVYQFGKLNDHSWSERAKDLNYTIGPGLRFLAEKTGADAALFLVGLDTVSSAGRKAMFVLTTIVFGLPIIPPGVSYVAVGLVDLQSGKLLWQSYDYGIGRLDLREPRDARSLTASVLETYPDNAPVPK